MFYGNGGTSLNIMFCSSLIFFSFCLASYSDFYLMQAIFLIAHRKQVEQEIQTLATAAEYANKVKLLTTIPAIGILTAMTFLTEIGSFWRFRNTDHLSSYCVLTPDCRNSGQTERIIGITRRGNAVLKTILIECS